MDSLRLHQLEPSAARSRPYGALAWQPVTVLQPFARDVISSVPAGRVLTPRIDARRNSPCRRNLKNAFRSRCEPAAQSTVTLVRYARRRVHCANEVEDAGTPACVTKLEVPQRMQARRDRNGASAYTSGHRAQEAVCDRLCQPQTPAAPSASALMPKTCTRSRVSVPDSEPT